MIGANYAKLPTHTGNDREARRRDNGRLVPNEITGISRRTGSPERVYNFEVETYGTYVANGFAVHNGLAKASVKTVDGLAIASA